MAPSVSISNPTMKLTRIRRSGSNACVGWNCLGDAAQFGVILVIIAFAAALGYIYWRLQIKPNRRSSYDEERAPSGNYCEFTRNPGESRISITIYQEPRREPRPRDDQDDGETKPTKTRALKRRKAKDEPTQLDEDIDQPSTPKSLGDSGASKIPLLPPSTAHPFSSSDIHLIPPPPPPILWAAGPSVFPPPPPFGPPVILGPGPPPPPFIQEPPNLNPAATPCPPYAPPPYFNQHGAQLPHQEPMLGAEAAVPRARSSQPARWSSPQNIHQDGTAREAPAATDHPQRRRWFSMGATPPQTGHARTLSDTESVAPRSRSPSPSLLPAPVSLPTPHRGRGRLRHTSDKRLRLRSPPHHPTQQIQHSRLHNIRGDAQSHGEDELSYQSMIDLGSTNTSIEAVHGSQESWTGSQNRAYESPSPERRGRRARSPRTRVAHSNTVPLSNLRHQQLPSPDRATQPSPDIQYPSPEPSRAQVSFSLPRDSDDVFTSSSRQSGSWGSSRAQYSELGSGRDGASRRSQARSEREQDRPPGRMVGMLRRMRQALRGGP